MKKVTIISLAVLALSIQSCRKDYNYVAPAAAPITTPVHFATEVYPLLMNAAGHCADCHDGSGSALDFVNGGTPTASAAYASLFPTYIVANDALASQLYISITTGVASGSNKIMPKDVNAVVYTPAELEIIKTWINQGALNN